MRKLTTWCGVLLVVCLGTGCATPQTVKPPEPLPESRLPGKEGLPQYETEEEPIIESPPAVASAVPAEAPDEKANQPSEVIREEVVAKRAPVETGIVEKKSRPEPTIPVGQLVSPPVDLTHLPTTINRSDHSLMVLVPRGSYLVTQGGTPSASVFGGESTLYPQPLNAFYIDRNEITVEQFKRFSPQYNETPLTGGETCPKCPAMGVTLVEARTYCTQSGKQLPTESQWEAAARGASSRPYPWGKAFEAKRANLSGEEDGHAGPAQVGSFATGASVFGAMDMVGNVWEWVESETRSGTPSPASTSPMQFGLVKGGGYRSSPKIAVLSSRNRVPADIRNPTFGFRCVKPHTE